MNCSGLALNSPWRVPLVQPANTSGRPLDTGTATAWVPRPGQSVGARGRNCSRSPPQIFPETERRPGDDSFSEKVPASWKRCLHPHSHSSTAASCPGNRQPGHSPLAGQKNRRGGGGRRKWFRCLKDDSPRTPSKLELSVAAIPDAAAEHRP